ncbi:MAG: valine--tRNA ligase [Planctomycetota bacterium]
MSQELPKQYDPSQVESAVYRRWLEAKAFAAFPDERERRYVIMMPLPNVTGALHMGHAMDNVMQDVLIRWHRMMGDNTLWMAGTDHAGIATQAVVEKRLRELEGKTRHDLGREGLVARIWEWALQCQKRIVSQLQAMGCSCDWDRQRFTMDKVCARAVRWTFFRMFRDGLVYRGDRLVNWDCFLQTAVADDEVIHETVAGSFWHLRYPVAGRRPGDPEHVVVATTRPETMLGDTAVACHPDPAGALERATEDAKARLASAPQRERTDLAAEVERLEARRETHLPLLLRLADMAREGREVVLPLLERRIPLILDEWAKPELGTGCVKITPAHDHNDYEVWTRHRDRIGIVNILNPDGTLNENAGPYAGLDRFVARDRVVRDLESRGLLEAVEPHSVEIGHSDRSATPIEPYLSKQWFVRMGDAGEVVCGRGTRKEFVAKGLAQAAMDAVQGPWGSPTGRKLAFHPDPERYASTYLDWLAEKRDWCVSRQLWWGHRIPIWSKTCGAAELARVLEALRKHAGREDLCVRVAAADGTSRLWSGAEPPEELAPRAERVDVLACLRDEAAEAQLGPEFERLGLVQDPDVLDTWFSSAIWPHSTLGWPDPETAEVDPGQARLGSDAGRPDCLSYYYPGSCLVTARDIITLWVARMVLMGLYNLGDVPFTDCFVHANVLDGKGERMSKSKGNGIDPVDIIERYGADAMRYVLCEMQTGTQDIRLPVQAISPYTGEFVDLATAKHGRTIFTYICPKTGKEFDVLGTMPGIPAARLVSDRFEVGRNFSNKLLNATRFALMNLEGAAFESRPLEGLADEDRWILSRLSRAIGQVHGALEAYNPSAAISAAREFFWSELCDWYVEIVKPRLKVPSTAPAARQVLAFALDQVLRLLHPFVPFITEMLWERLNEIAPARGIDEPLEQSDLLIRAAWPRRREAWEDAELEARFAFVQAAIRAVRDIRSKYVVPPGARLRATIRANGTAAETIARLRPIVESLAGLEGVEISPDAKRSPDSATAVVGEVEIFVPGIVDVEKERARLARKKKDLEKRLEGARKKLANAEFLKKAAREVVERERRRLAELEAELEVVAANLEDLGA